MAFKVVRRIDNIKGFGFIKTGNNHNLLLKLFTYKYTRPYADSKHVDKRIDPNNLAQNSSTLELHIKPGMLKRK